MFGSFRTLTSGRKSASSFSFASYTTGVRNTLATVQARLGATIQSTHSLPEFYEAFAAGSHPFVSNGRTSHRANTCSSLLKRGVAALDDRRRWYDQLKDRSASLACHIPRRAIELLNEVRDESLPHAALGSSRVGAFPHAIVGNADVNLPLRLLDRDDNLTAAISREGMLAGI